MIMMTVKREKRRNGERRVMAMEILNGGRIYKNI